jgi:hypothetical protein
MTEPTDHDRKLLERFCHVSKYGVALKNDALRAIAAARRDAIEERDERLRQIRTWCDAYPVEVFPEPDLAAAKTALGDDLYSALHAAWARRLLKGIRDLTEPAEPKCSS